jgi:GT2 family glycosyltransferase
VGPGQARNEGAKVARGKILLFLDSDTELDPGGIDLLINYSREHPSVDVFSGWDSAIPLNSGFFPRFKALSMISAAPKTDADVAFIAGRCFGIKREVMLESGGFKAEYKGADVEDFELGYRLRRHYGKIRYLSGLRIQHRYPSMWKQFRLYFKRVRMWLNLKGETGGFDDSFGTGLNDAIIQLTSVVWPFGFIFSGVIGSLIPGAVLFLGALGSNRKFLFICLREEGATFTILSVVCHSFLAISVVAGTLVELLKNPGLLLGVIKKRA